MYTMSVDTVDGTTYESDAENYAAEELNGIADIFQEKLNNWGTIIMKSNGLPVVIATSKIVAIYLTKEIS